MVFIASFFSFGDRGASDFCHWCENIGTFAKFPTKHSKQQCLRAEEAPPNAHSSVDNQAPNLQDKNPPAGDYWNKTTPLHLAAQSGHLDVIEYMSSFVKDINQADSYGWTPIHLAAEYGHIDVVKWYTKNLDDPNPGLLSNDEFNGSTPMHSAAKNGHFDIVKFLASLLTDKNPSDDNGATPLHGLHWIC